MGDAYGQADAQGQWTGPPRARSAVRPLAVLLLLAVIAVLVLLVVLPDDRESTGCTALEAASWSADAPTTDEFARYGDDAARLDDWTGGDGTHSVRLPDGRTLWLFSDSFLGKVNPPPNLQGQPHAWRDTTTGGGPAWVRNAAVLMSPSGRLERTLTGGTPAAPAPLFPDPAPTAAGQRQWRWPVQATVEPRAPGSSERVVRVLLWVRQAAPAPWLYGVPVRTEVATLSLPDLRLEGIERVSGQKSVRDPARRVLYGTTAVRADGWTYVFGGDDGRGAVSAGGKPSHAHLARVPDGRLADASAWRYWDGSRWRSGAPAAAPVLGDGGRRGVGSAFTVVRQGGTWVLLTMDAGGSGAAGLTTVTSYWACSPEGPWHGPAARGFDPPLPPDSGPSRGAAAYNPQAHPEFGADGRLLLSYDVNWLGTEPSVVQANVNRNVALYRPRFVRLRLVPAREPSASPASAAPTSSAPASASPMPPSR